MNQHQQGQLLSFADFMERPWTPQEMIVDPWFPTGGISMLFGSRGGGKSYITLGLALHIAAGWPFLDMAVPKARKLIYIDGEMSAAEVKTRLVKLESGMGPFPTRTFTNAHILSHETFDRGIPDLSCPGAGRNLVRQMVRETSAEVLILDNCSCLLQTGNENEAESWANFASWLLNFRREHVAVLVIHHTGKNGQQRGTSKREDLMNSSVQITETSKGPPLTLNWAYTKVRSFTPNEHNSPKIEICFSPPGVDYAQETAAVIRRARPEEETISDETDEVLRLRKEGLSLRKIADRIGRSKSTVERILK